MKFKLLSLIVIVASLCSCDGMYDTLDEYAGETVYPAKFDTIVGYIGFERVEIDLMKIGRVPASKIKLGKAKKTIVEYDGKVVVIDTLSSWVGINGLTESKLHRFKIYTIDDYDNKSVYQEIALIPFTRVPDLEGLPITAPRIMLSPSAAVVEWSNGLSSILLNYCSMEYNYVDKDGIERRGEVKQGETPRFYVGNLEAGKPVTVNVNYKVIPKMDNKPILDTVVVSRPLVLNMPVGSTEFSVDERAILIANGVTTFTADAVAPVTKLVFPIHTNSLQDIFYFAGIKELDLTGGSLFPITTLDYDRNGVRTTIGGGDWVPFMRKAGGVSTANAQALKDLLLSGMLTKVRYVPHSMGIDDLLAPYVSTGVVELVTLPAEAPITKKFWVDGVVQDSNWKVDVVYPATDAPAGGLAGGTFKVTLKAKNATFVIALPKEYQFNIDEYKYIKMDVYTPPSTALTGNYADYKRLWVRVMNNMWAFSGNSSFGQEYWDYPREKFTIADANLARWTNVTIDMSTSLNKHTRVLVLNIGGEPSMDFSPPADMVYYLSNLRFTKE